MSGFGGNPVPSPLPRPPDGATAHQGPPPPNHLVWAILSLLSCWPLSIASIVFSTRVNSKWARGETAGARADSETAKKLAILSPVVWVIILALWVLSRLALAASGGFGS